MQYKLQDDVKEPGDTVDIPEKENESSDESKEKPEEKKESFHLDSDGKEDAPKQSDDDEVISSPRKKLKKSKSVLESSSEDEIKKPKGRGDRSKRKGKDHHKSTPSSKTEHKETEHHVRITITSYFTFSSIFCVSFIEEKQKERKTQRRFVKR